MYTNNDSMVWNGTKFKTGDKVSCDIGGCTNITIEDSIIIVFLRDTMQKHSLWFYGLHLLSQST